MLPIGGIYPTWHPHQTRARVKFHSTKLKTAKKSRSKAAQMTPKKSASMAIVEAPTRAATQAEGEEGCFGEYTRPKKPLPLFLSCSLRETSRRGM